MEDTKTDLKICLKNPLNVTPLSGSSEAFEGTVNPVEGLFLADQLHDVKEMGPFHGAHQNKA